VAANFNQEREHVHLLVDKLPPGKLGAVRDLLEVFLEDDRDTLSPAERAAIAEADEWSRRNSPIPHEQVLAELGLTMDDWERMSRER
jgi:hypothetical protein